MSAPAISDLELLSRTEILSRLPELVDQILEKDCNRDKKLMEICILLNQSVSNYDWVGFYLVDYESERELILGPYVGEETDHTRIPFGVGICGQVAETNETFISDDVLAESNYLSCSTKVRSEIVVPIMKKGRFVAQLDIDSHEIAGMTEKDREVLELICTKLSSMF